MELNQYDGGGGGSQQANKRPRSEDEDLLPSSHHQFKFNSTANLFNFECQTFEAIIADTSLDSPEKIQMATKGLILTLVQEAELLLKDAFKGASLGRPNPTANVPIPSTSFASVVAEKDKPVKPAPPKPKAKSTFVNLAPSFESHVVVSCPECPVILPRYCLFRVDGEVRDDEICESFRSNHSVQSLLEKREIRVVHRSNNAAHSTSTVFIEVDNQVAEILGQYGRIPVAGLVHRYERSHTLKQCFRCCGFGHRASACPAAHPICYRCGSAEHEGIRCSVNAKKSPTVILEIANLANSTQADIVLLQELSTNFFWPTRGFQAFFFVPGAYIPSGIVARSNLHPIPLTSPDTAITSIAICLEQSIIVVHSAYWHGLRAADDFIPLLEDTIRRTSLPVILGMDTNAHSPTWGIGARLDFRGANLEEFASFNDFHFLGPPVDSTWSNGPLSSSIDVTLASSSLAIHVTRGLLDEMAFTDHIPIWTIFLDMVNNETKSSWVESSCKEQTFKSFLNSSLHQTLQYYKTVKAVVDPRTESDQKAAIRKAKSKSWFNLCKEVSSAYWSDIHRFIARGRGSPRGPPLLKHDNGSLYNPHETCQTLLNHFFLPDTRPHPQRNAISAHSDEPEFKPWEVLRAIHRCGKRKALGPDGLGSKCLDLGGPSLQFLLAELFTKCLRIGYFPRQWKEGRLILLPKSSNSATSQLEKYRPITLLNTMAKVFERCILARLQRLADRHGWFFEDQYKTVLGIVNGRSAEDALASITQLIEERQAHWRKTLVISSDISKAFDTVWRPAIIQNLERLNCSESITCLVKSFLEDRTVSYSAWTATECTSSQLGTPQGSALSPFLWNIVARTIFTLPSIIDSRLIAYADDFTLMTQVRSRLPVSATNTFLERLTSWCTINGLNINPIKTQACLFQWRNVHPNSETGLRALGQPLNIKKTVKILGVEFYQTRGFVAHLRKITRRCRSIIPRLTHTIQVSAISITGSPPFDIIVRSRTAFLKEINEGNFESRPGPASLPYPPDRRQLSFSLNIEEITTPIIFTDGSKNEAEVGAAIVPSSEDQQPVLLRLHPDCTAFQAELLAIRWAVRLVKEGYSRNAITIASDCRSALSAICTSGPVRSTLVAKIILALNTNQNVNLCWVPGHCGIDGKERADRAAKNAAVLILEPSFSILPRSLARNHSRAAALDAWTEVYCQDHYNRHLRRIAHTPDRLLQFLPKTWFSGVLGKTHLAHIVWRNNRLDHLLFRCPAFKQHRMKTALLLGKTSFDPVSSIILTLRGRNVERRKSGAGSKSLSRTEANGVLIDAFERWVTQCPPIGGPRGPQLQERSLREICKRLGMQIYHNSSSSPVHTCPPHSLSTNSISLGTSLGSAEAETLGLLLGADNLPLATIVLSLCDPCHLVSPLLTTQSRWVPIEVHQFTRRMGGLVAVALLAAVACGTTPSKERCEEISIPMCRGIGYNFTAMPNQFHHDTQDEAGLEVHQFWPLVEIQCSDDLRFFLCSMYTPICMEDYQGRLPACRSVCERARSGCAPIMRQYGFAWPERMNCDLLPRYGDTERLCMDSKEGSAPEPPTDRRPPPLRVHKLSKTSKDRGVAAVLPECGCQCRPPMVPLLDWVDRRVLEHVATGGVSRCATPCRSPFFSSTFASSWLGLWAVTCCVSASLTVLTFLINPQRFRYPERSIIFMSLCYLMVSVGYIVRLALGHEAVACDGPIIRYHTTGRPAACTLVFLLVYFFGMASSLWWVILTLTWLLAAGLKWGNEAIAGLSQYFHLAAWLLPTVKSIAVLALGAVDGDPVAGICYVGNLNRHYQRLFVIAPLAVYLLLGTAFLLSGFVALFRIRKVIRQQAHNKVDKLEKLMIRIGVFSVLYTVPATIVLGCHFYEHQLREGWERRHNCPCDTDARDSIPPEYSIFMLKYFMCLVVGITTGFWIVSIKTLDSWRRLCLGLPSTDPPPRTFKPLSPASCHVGALPVNSKSLSHV
ncbi:FZD5 [Cordylochernes scorpioides]|uniref:FZD5 n=1 Tax=Cordylochernes scorpioides TaxID=51811 RepID=A0ABY6JV20_9ARAC|nr:FZD5 [Cordylochernes scorpioides]